MFSSLSSSFQIAVVAAAAAVIVLSTMLELD
jgi:hypothetical protein